MKKKHLKTMVKNHLNEMERVTKVLKTLFHECKTLPKPLCTEVATIEASIITMFREVENET